MRVRKAPQTEREHEIERQREVVKRDRAVPRELMAEAVAHFRGLFPEALRIEPKLYSGRVYCEVWGEAGAQVVFY